MDSLHGGPFYAANDPAGRALPSQLSEAPRCLAGVRLEEPRKRRLMAEAMVLRDFGKRLLTRNEIVARRLHPRAHHELLRAHPEHFMKEPVQLPHRKMRQLRERRDADRPAVICRDMRHRVLEPRRARYHIALAPVGSHKSHHTDHLAKRILHRQLRRHIPIPCSAPRKERLHPVDHRHARLHHPHIIRPDFPHHARRVNVRIREPEDFLFAGKSQQLQQPRAHGDKTPLPILRKKKHVRELTEEQTELLPGTHAPEKRLLCAMWNFSRGKAGHGIRRASIRYGIHDREISPHPAHSGCASPSRPTRSFSPRDTPRCRGDSPP